MQGLSTLGIGDAHLETTTVASTIATVQADDPTSVHIETHLPDRRYVTKHLAQIPELDGGGRGVTAHAPVACDGDERYSYGQ